ncbi:MAG: aldo/keto reductase, partial [Victivallales bacterium]|nr:aldo/keto reductase [Victivallales bacterium]
TAEIKPMVNQIEFHPGYYQPELVRWCKAHGMVVEAWSPLGCGAVLSDPTLAKIAAKYGKSVAQVCIRFALQYGVVPMPKSTHADRIADNMKVFDFDLTDDDMTAIMTMPPVGYSTYHPTEAPADTLFGGGYDID